MRLGLGRWLSCWLLSASQGRVSPNPKAEELCSDGDKTYKGQEGWGNGKRRGTWRPHLGSAGLKWIGRGFLVLSSIWEGSSQKAPHKDKSLTDLRDLLIIIESIFLISQLGLGVGQREPMSRCHSLLSCPDQSKDGRSELTLTAGFTVSLSVFRFLVFSQDSFLPYSSHLSSSSLRRAISLWKSLSYEQDPCRRSKTLFPVLS